jgi:ribosomal protein S18 acetylase RimI-like enzyme
MNPIIRKATIEDIASILEITREAFVKYVKEAQVPYNLSALTETYEKVEADLKNKTVLVAILDSRIVGTIRFEMLPGKIAYISRFAVRLDIHNCGVGKELVKTAIEYATAQDAQIASLHTASKMTALVRLYYGLGFYIHSTAADRGYIRALFCRELVEGANFDTDAVKHL